MLFHRKKESKFKQKAKKLGLNVNNYCIKQVSEFKYLGVLLDSKLNWHNHIEHLCTQVSKSVGVLYRLRKLPRNAKKLLYHSLVSSRLRYGISSWGSAGSTALRKLNLLNNKAVKNIKPFTNDLSVTFKNMKFLTIHSL